MLNSCYFVPRELRYLRKQKKKLKERLVVKGGVAEESGELIRQENLFRLKNPRVHEDVERWEEPDGCGQEGEGSGQEEVGSGQEDEGSGLEDEGSGLEDEGSGQEEVGSGLEDEGSGQEGVGSGLEAERSGQNEAKGSQDEDLSGVEDEEVASEEERGRKVDKKGRMCGSGGAKEHGFEEGKTLPKLSQCTSLKTQSIFRRFGLMLRPSSGSVIHQTETSED